MNDTDSKKDEMIEEALEKIINIINALPLVPEQSISLVSTLLIRMFRNVDEDYAVIFSENIAKFLKDECQLLKEFALIEEALN